MLLGNRTLLREAYRGDNLNAGLLDIILRYVPPLAWFIANKCYNTTARTTLTACIKVITALKLLQTISFELIRRSLVKPRWNLVHEIQA